MRSILQMKKASNQLQLLALTLLSRSGIQKLSSSKTSEVASRRKAALNPQAR